MPPNCLETLCHRHYLVSSFSTHHVAPGRWQKSENRTSLPAVTWWCEEARFMTHIVPRSLNGLVWTHTLHTHTHTHTQTQAYTYARMHARTHTHTHAHTQARTHARTHIHTHARTHARTHTHTHTHAHAHTAKTIKEREDKAQIS